MNEQLTNQHIHNHITKYKHNTVQGQDRKKEGIFEIHYTGKTDAPDEERNVTKN